MEKIPDEVSKQIEALPKVGNEKLSDYIKFLETDRLFFVDEVRGWLNLLLKDEISMSKFVENFNIKYFNASKALSDANKEIERLKGLIEDFRRLYVINEAADNRFSGYPPFVAQKKAEESWQQFKTENNL